MKKILMFIIFILALGCTNKGSVDLSDSNSKYYYCAYLADGIDFQIQNRINSIDEFYKNKKSIYKLDKNSDANYYKIVKKDGKIMIFGYSMKTDELREWITLDSDTKRLLSRETFKPYGNVDKKCQWSYNTLNNKLTSIKQCNDNSKTITHLEYSEKDKRYITREYLIYENDNLTDKVIYSKTGIPLNDKGAEGGAYDVCIPFRSYRLDEKLP